MTRIEAIVRPSSLEALRVALAGNPWLGGLTVAEVKDYGRQRGQSVLHRGTEYAIDFVPRIKVELVVPDPLVPSALHDLERRLRSDVLGDGRIFVTRIDEAVRVRTGERGEDAL